MLKAGYKHYKRKGNKSKQFKKMDLVSEPDFIKGLLINRLTWLTPYIYVFLFGRNLSLWIYLMILFWMSVTGYLCVHRSLKAIVGDKVFGKISQYQRVSKRLLGV
jgi:hypothetical protein